MKKVFCTALFLFATTICFSAQTGSTDKIGKASEIVLPTIQSDAQVPTAGCPHVPPQCPDGV